VDAMFLQEQTSQTENAFRAFESIMDKNLTSYISGIETELVNKDTGYLNEILLAEGIQDTVLSAALKIKEFAGQINVIIHALGILLSLPYILEPNEVILSLSLGAGNTGRQFDLETDQRVGEFKFIKWQGGPEAIRQNSLFIDFFNLAEHESKRKRDLYVLGKHYPLRFFNNNRAIDSVLSKNHTVWQDFHEKYNDKYTTVSQYYNDFKHTVNIKDLCDFVPVFSTNMNSKG
jgi:hypothetical protein